MTVCDSWLGLCDLALVLEFSRHLAQDLSITYREGGDVDRASKVESRNSETSSSCLQALSSLPFFTVFKEDLRGWSVDLKRGDKVTKWCSFLLRNNMKQAGRVLNWWMSLFPKVNEPWTLIRLWDLLSSYISFHFSISIPKGHIFIKSLGL